MIEKEGPSGFQVVWCLLVGDTNVHSECYTIALYQCMYCYPVYMPKDINVRSNTPCFQRVCMYVQNLVT